MSSESVFCLELTLQPLSELLVRQVGKSNVQWFTYPFLPPTTFSGLLYSILVDESDDGWRKNYVEVDDDSSRQLSQKYPNAISIGAYPQRTAWRRGRHYRQHLGGDVFNYESFAPAGNKKLAIAESFWTPKLRGFVLSSGRDDLELIRDQPSLLFRISRVGKKGFVKVAQARLTELTLQHHEGFVDTIAPIEMIKRVPDSVEVFHVPIRLGDHLQWRVYPFLFGSETQGECYKGGGKDEGEDEIVIPKRLVDLVSGAGSVSC